MHHSTDFSETNTVDCIWHLAAQNLGIYNNGDDNGVVGIR